MNGVGGAMRASIAAGPIFVASVLFSQWAIAPSAALTVGAEDAWPRAAMLLMPGLLSIPVGFVLSVIPNLFGSAALTWLGTVNVAARLAPVWAMTGAAMAGVPIAIVTASDRDASATITMAMTGAACALVAHRFTRWPA